MATDKKISELPDATLPIATGVKFEALQGGINVKVDADDMPGSSGGTVTSVTGTTNRITSSGGATPAIDIDAAYDAAITSQINAAIVGLWDDRGTFDASVAAYPSSGGSGTAGAILKGDIWTISVAGTLPTGQVVEIGDTVRALIDTPGNTQANWAILQNNIGFVPAPIASPTFTGTPAAPTAAPGTNTTQVATTAFVQAALSAAKSIVIAVTDEVTIIGTGTAKVSFRMPYAMTLTAVRASLVVAQGSGSIFTVDINEGGTTILSTKLTIDNTELTSVTAATPAVISDASLADDALITVDVDQVGSGSAIGLKITLIGT